MPEQWTDAHEARLRERAQWDPLLRAVVDRMDEIERDRRAARNECLDAWVEVRQLERSLRIEAATAWARGDQVVCDTLEQAAERVLEVL